MDEYRNLEDIISFTDSIVAQTFREESNNTYNIDYNTINGKLVRAINAGVAINIFNLSKYFSKEILPQFSPLTATGDYLELIHGDLWNVLKNTANNASGSVIFQGDLDTIIDANTELSSTENSYITTNSAQIQEINITPTSIELVGTTAKVTLPYNLVLGTGMTVSEISGANETEYNVTDEVITVTGENKFEYQVFGSPSTPATGNINIKFIYGNASCESSNTGSDKNLVNGTVLNLVNPQTGLNDNIFVSYAGLTNGRDDEDDSDYRGRVVDRIQTIAQGWNAGAIEVAIRTYDNQRFSNAKVLIPRAERPDGAVEGGYSTIYILNSDNSLISQADRDALKDYLIKGRYFLEDEYNRVNILSPELLDAPISITLDPEFDTDDMRNAVLQTFADMNNDTSFVYYRADIKITAINSILRGTVDINGIFLEDNYTMNTVSDVSPAYNEFPILGVDFA